MAENWRFGDITEDKKLPVRFLDADGDPWPLASLVSFGVKIVTKQNEEIVKIGNIDSTYEDTYIETDAYTVLLQLPATLNPKRKVDLYGVTIIVIADAQMPGGTFTDISENPVLLYNVLADYKVEV